MVEIEAGLISNDGTTCLIELCRNKEAFVDVG